MLDLMLKSSWSTTKLGVYQLIVARLERKRVRLGLDDAPALDPSLERDEVLESLVAFRERLRQQYPLESKNPQVR